MLGDLGQFYIGVDTTAAPTTEPPGPPASALPAPTGATPAAAICPLTLPNGQVYPGDYPDPHAYGNGLLYVKLRPYNVVLVGPEDVAADGSLGVKVAWARGPGVVGKLSVQGRRLDQPAPPLRAVIPWGYGETGLQPTGLIFPTEGCWEVTGQVGEARLTFVTLVLTVPHNPYLGD